MDLFILLFFFFILLLAFWWWIFRKTESKPKRIALTLSLAAVSTPIIYGLIIMAWFFTISYYPNRDFDRKAWLTDTDRRYEYSHDLINSKLLIGKTRKQVEQILGKNSDTSQTELYYYIGYRPEIGGIDPSSIIIEFKNGKVDNVTEHDR
jgi:hypothetical protein